MSAPTDIAGSLTHAELTRLLDYDPETGVFTNRKSRGHAKAGARAGYMAEGYIRLRVHTRTYKAHRLAWFYVYGRWPVEQLDHINGVKDDNRIANLREANNTQNVANTLARSNNKCGKKGVSQSRSRWRAKIHKNSRQIHLGTFDSAEEAHAAYFAAARVYFGKFARTE